MLPLAALLPPLVPVLEAYAIQNERVLASTHYGARTAAELVVAVAPPLFAVAPAFFAVAPPFLAVAPPFFAVAPLFLAVAPLFFAVAPPFLAVAPPAVAPEAAIRASRSAAVVQVMLVPGALTRGSAAQLSNNGGRQ